jgi:hypothetical protein
MQQISLDELDAFSSEWDAKVDRDGSVDGFCSRSAWQIAFARAFAPERTFWLAHRGDSMAVLAERADGVLEPLENMWGFGAPLIGAEAGGLLGPWLLARPRPALLLGLPGDKERLMGLLEPLAGAYDFQVLAPTTRFVARLDGGLDEDLDEDLDGGLDEGLDEGLDGTLAAWLAGRSPSFRRNLRAARRRVEAEAIEFRWVEGVPGEVMHELYRGVLDVEARSWKGVQGAGAATGPMETFYRELWLRLGSRGQLRVLLAERGGVAVGYLHGGCVGDRFRGLQFSFDHAHARAGLGNVLQYEAIGRLAQAGIRRYDLGAFSDYKGRWGDEGLQTLGLVLRPRVSA